MAERKLTFVKAGDKDVSEVTISTGTHAAQVANAVARETYTVSYPGGGDSPAFKKKFEEAAQAIINDAVARGVKIGEP